MPLTKKKPPFAPDQVVVATRTFGWEKGVVHAGEKYRGADPVVVENWTAFVDGETLPSELPNMWNELAPPPDYHSDDSIRVGTSSVAHVPPHRLVRARANFWFPGSWAPGSPGERSGKVAPFGSAISIGQLLEITNPVVQRHPEHFEWPRRDVTLADVERFANEVTGTGAGDDGN